MPAKNQSIIDQTITNIKTLKIQGATNTALTSLKALSEYKFDSWDGLYTQAKRLAQARPNEPLTRNLLSVLTAELRSNFEPRQVRLLASRLSQLVLDSRSKTAAFAAGLIKNDKNYLSHCHSSSLVQSFIQAHQAGQHFCIWQTETRPRFQGRRTAAELHQAGVNVKLIVDNSAAWLISPYGSPVDIEAVFIGADVISQDGWVVNKVGSLGLALTASKVGIPVYVIASLLKFENRPADQIPVEVRSIGEVWPQAPKGLDIVNFAFDKTPPHFITAMVTEAGLIKPSQVKTVFHQTYPQITDIFT